MLIDFPTLLITILLSYNTCSLLTLHIIKENYKLSGNFINHHLNIYDKYNVLKVYIRKLTIINEKGKLEAKYKTIH